MTAPGDYIKELGALRDALLVLASAVYAVGYVTWATYSHRNRLGTVRALDAQYFVIGAPVAVLLSITVAIMWQLRSWLETWNTYILSLESWVIWSLVISLVALCIIFNSLAVRVASRDRFRSAYILFLMALTAIAAIPDTGGLLRLLSQIFVSVLIVSILTAVITLYIAVVYERIPHCLGGGAGRLASFDLLVKDISPSLLAQLISSSSEDSQAVVSSRDVTVVSVSENWLSVRIGPLSDRKAPIIEIPRSVITSIVWR